MNNLENSEIEPDFQAPAQNKGNDFPDGYKNSLLIMEQD